jgi:hypothetical protein
MTTKKRTWLWIVLACLAVCVIAMFVLAGAGMYFVMNHVNVRHSSSADALRSFDDARKEFKDQKPLFVIDSREQPRIARPLSEIPNGSTKPENLWILAWDPDEEKVVKLSLPFWMLRMGRKKMTVMESSGFDLERLNVDWRELERIGPALVFDLKSSKGERVLIWTR